MRASLASSSSCPAPSPPATFVVVFNRIFQTTSQTTVNLCFGRLRGVATSSMAKRERLVLTESSRWRPSLKAFRTRRLNILWASPGHPRFPPAARFAPSRFFLLRCPIKIQNENSLLKLLSFQKMTFQSKQNLFFFFLPWCCWLENPEMLPCQNPKLKLHSGTF